MKASEMLARHREVWDMPTLAETETEIIDWLAERYEVIFPEMFSGQVYVVTKATGEVTKMGTTDVREAVARLLEHQVLVEAGAVTA